MSRDTARPLVLGNIALLVVRLSMSALSWGVYYHLVVHQAVHVPDFKHQLLCLIQCRTYGVTVNDCPRLYCEDHAGKLHAIVAEDADGDKVVLPLQLSSVISHLNVELISLDEWNCHACPHIELMHKDLTWDPSPTIYEEQ